MRLSLPTLVLAPALVAAAAVMPQHASAAVLHVPFAFTVNGHTLPAGDYSVNSQLNGDAVTLATADHSRQFSWLLLPGEPTPGDTKVVMKFDVTDSGYQLRSIQYRAMITNRLDKKSHESEDKPVHVIRGE
jgi:hypothetical protein